MLLPIIILLVTFDQFTKYLAVILLRDHPYPIFIEQIRLTYSENPGIAFGIKVPQLLLIPLTVTFLYLVFFYCRRDLPKTRMSTIALAFVLSGGVGNLIDRFVHGHVIDFIGIFNYPVFNVADIYITVGVILLLIIHFRLGKK